MTDATRAYVAAGDAYMKHNGRPPPLAEPAGPGSEFAWRTAWPRKAIAGKE